MAYEGEIMHSPPPPHMFDFTRTSAVIVSGDGPNKWGHMLLNTGGVGGMYFQIAGVIAQPRYMNEAGYKRYLQGDRQHGLTPDDGLLVSVLQENGFDVSVEQKTRFSTVFAGIQGETRIDGTRTPRRSK